MYQFKQTLGWRSGRTKWEPHMLPKLASVTRVVITLITRNEARPLKVVEALQPFRPSMMNIQPFRVAELG
jgi:hypothetical protein